MGENPYEAPNEQPNEPPVVPAPREFNGPYELVPAYAAVTAIVVGILLALILGGSDPKKVIPLSIFTPIGMLLALRIFYAVKRKG